jgi:CheY-like chemotaxis protein
VGLEGLSAQAAARLGLSDMPSGPCVHLWVADNGAGMDRATRERIFDPFFTTKPVGKGTGLGLSVVHGIVRSHRGTIVVDTAPGQGSCFHIYLPLATPPRSGPITGAGELTELAPGQGQRVLYVDDDEVMVLMVQRLLQRAGYRVTVRTAALEAVALVRAQPERFDLVVSDFNMPEMSGLDLAAQLLALRPGLPIIISSGFIADDLRQRALALGVRGLMKKENSLEELAGMVQKLLAGH